jgi:hypothetical protein
MAVKTALGRVSGDLTSLHLGITVWDDAGATVDYLDALNAALGVAPATLFGLFPSGSPTVQERSDSIYLFEIVYESLEKQQSDPPPQPETGTLTRSASASAKGKVLKHFLEPIGVWGADGLVEGGLVHSRWAVKITHDPGAYYSDIAEQEFQPYAETRSLEYYAPDAEITDEYLDAVEDLVNRGCFNNAEFFGKPAGTVQIVRFNCNQRSDTDKTLSFGFAYQPIREDVQVSSDIVIPELCASWYYWTANQVLFDSTAHICEVVPKYAIVGRVWEEEDFSVLNLPGQ